MKKALLTTTALVALNSAAFASSIDTPVNSASSTHHTHSAATIVWSGDANIKYNVYHIIQMLLCNVSLLKMCCW